MKPSKVLIAILTVSLLAGCGVVDLHPYRFIEVGAKPLHWAAANGDIEKVRTLISQGSDVDLRADTTRATPLHFASWKGQYETAKLLINLGANVNARTDYGETPLTYASGGESDECYEILLPDPGPGLGDNHTAVVALLIEHGADVNSTSRHGGTALHAATFCNAAHVAQHLIYNGADFDDAMLVLAACRAPDVARLLILAGADVNIRDSSNGLTPLLFAAKCGRPDVVEMLVQHGADLNATDRSGNTPLDLAEDPETISAIRRHLEES